MAMHASSLSLDAAIEQPSLTLLPAATYQAPVKPNSNAPRDPKAIARAMTQEQLKFGADAAPSGLAAAIAQQQQPGGLGLLPSTTYLPERPQTAAPQSNVRMPRGMEQYKDPRGFSAAMPPTSTQPGAAPFMEGRPFWYLYLSYDPFQHRLLRRIVFISDSCVFLYLSIFSMSIFASKHITTNWRHEHAPKNIYIILILFVHEAF
jgi:hypothetical protein